MGGDEEASFWLLKHMVENVAPEYHTKTMKGLKRDIDAIAELIKLRLPIINEKIGELGLPWIVIMTKWLICLFAEVLPIETTLRLWDAIFSEGYKIIFRASLAIILILKDEIMKVDDINELAELFRNIGKDRRFLDGHSFMQFMFSIKLKRREILFLRRNNTLAN
jgi:TBC1 domain family member 6